MPFVRTSVLIQQGNAGWSENFYLPNATVLQGLDITQQLAVARRHTLSQAATINGIRVSQVDPTGLASVRLLNLPGTVTTGADTPFQSLVVYLRTDVFTKRAYLMRAVPDANIVGGIYTPSAGYAGAVRDYLALMINRGFAIRRVERDNPLLAIKGITSLGVLSSFVAHGLVADDLVQLYRTRDTGGYDVSGTYRVAAAPTGTTAELANWDSDSTVVKGQFRKFQYAYTNIASTEISGRIVSRKVGRPFGVPRGRVVARNRRPA